ncbi:hypothetical protein ACOMHN_032723 [Nucella lapillus]
MGGKTVFLVDFNISWDRPAHPNTVKAVDLLDMFSLSQAVNFPTHRDGHTIDWNLRAIDKSQFCADVAAVFHNQPPATVEQLEAHLKAVLDVHAPAIRRLPSVDHHLGTAPLLKSYVR